MKHILTQDELGAALANYPAPAGYKVSNVTVQRHSVDFVTIELEPTTPPAQTIGEALDK